MLLGPLLGVLLEASWGVLGASLAVLRPSWAFWSDLRVTWGLVGPFGEPFGAILARFGPLMGSVAIREAHATHTV